jgi:hypothetical protein
VLMVYSFLKSCNELGLTFPYYFFPFPFLVSLVFNFVYHKFVEIANDHKFGHISTG